jgi:2-C-methyl-D-erythritol 4-phosphate cytidylyltransferase
VSQFTVILAAAGKSSRFGDPLQKKVFSLLAGKPLWMYSAELFTGRSDVDEVILVIAPEDKDLFNEKFAGHAAMLGIRTVLGGAERAESVRNALETLGEDRPWVAIHDAARPCVSSHSVDAVFEAARQTGAAILAQACHSTVKRVDPSRIIIETVPRDQLWLAQTPQCFKTALLKQCYERHPQPQSVSDEAGLLEACGHPVTVVEGSPLNIKVTTKGDLRFAELALKALPQSKGFPF